MSTVVTHYMASLAVATLITFLEIAFILHVILVIFTYLVYRTQFNVKISLAVHLLDSFVSILLHATVSHKGILIVVTFLTYHTILFHWVLYHIALTIDTNDTALVTSLISIFSTAAGKVSNVIPRLSIILDEEGIPECRFCARRRTIASGDGTEDEIENRLRRLEALQRANNQEILAMRPPAPFSIIHQSNPAKKMRLASPIQLTERAATPSLSSTDSQDDPSPPSSPHWIFTPSAAASGWQLVERGGRRGRAKRARAEATAR
jgi:hypothetical protein